MFKIVWNYYKQNIKIRGEGFSVVMHFQLKIKLQEFKWKSVDSTRKIVYFVFLLLWSSVYFLERTTQSVRYQIAKLKFNLAELVLFIIEHITKLSQTPAVAGWV